jgi:hypothetical protein
MSTTMMHFRVREEMAGAVLKEVAALEPAERRQEAQALSQMMAQAVEGLEELWRGVQAHLERGVSASDAATLAHILTRSANLVASSLELLVRDSPALQEFREATHARLQAMKGQAASLRRLVELPAPAAEPARLRASLEQIERGEGVDAEHLLADLQR